MKKIRDFVVIKLILKLVAFVAFFAGFLFLIYLFVNRGQDKPLSVAKKIEKIPQVNFFKFLGWWWLVILLLLAVFGWFWRNPVVRVLEGWFERKKFFDFSQDVHMAMVSADVGKGKTLLLSMLARHLPHGIKKLGFVSNVPDARLLSYNDLNFDEPVPEIETYSIPKYYFGDEMNFLIEGTSFIENRIYHKGVAWLLQICRHHKMRVWMSATRDHHIWASIRHMANYYVKLGGLELLMSVGRFSFYNQRIRFYSQSEELVEEFNITVSNLDFALYDSFWMRGTRFFRPTLEGLAEKGRLEREKKRKEKEKKIKEQLEIEKREAIRIKRISAKMKDLVNILEEVKKFKENNPKKAPNIPKNNSPVKSPAKKSSRDELREFLDNYKREREKKIAYEKKNK